MRKIVFVICIVLILMASSEWRIADYGWSVRLLFLAGSIIFVYAVFRLIVDRVEAWRYGAQRRIRLDWRQWRRVIDAAIQAEGWNLERTGEELELLLSGPEFPKFKFRLMYEAPPGYAIGGFCTDYACSVGDQDVARLYAFQFGKGEIANVRLESGGRFRRAKLRFDEAGRLFLECEARPSGQPPRTGWSVRLERPILYLKRIPYPWEQVRPEPVAPESYNKQSSDPNHPQGDL